MKKPSMNEDIINYPVFAISKSGKLVPANWVYSTCCYNHSKLHLHHFVRQEIRNNSPDFYKKVEYLQKLILMPAQMNLDLETMGGDCFYKKYGINKNDLVFSRLKWREGYYDKE